MGLKLQLVFIFASLVTFIFLILKIRKHGLNIEDAIIWIIWAIFLLILSLIPGISTFISRKLGFISTSNFILVLFIFFLYILLFVQNIQISKLKDKQKELIQKLSIEEYKSRNEKP